MKTKLINLIILLTAILLFCVPLAGCKGNDSGVTDNEVPPPSDDKLPSLPCYTVNYDSNGGNGTMPHSTFICNKTEKLPPCTFTKPGYIHIGWELRSDDETTVLTPEQSVKNLAPAGGNITLYAKWDVAECRLSLNYNGGIGSEKSIIYNYGSMITNLPTPTKDNCIFEGWYTDSGLKVTNDSTFVIKEDLTLNARWFTYKYNIELFPDITFNPTHYPISLHVDPQRLKTHNLNAVAFTLTVEANSKISEATITIDNDGAEAHNFDFQEQGEVYVGTVILAADSIAGTNSFDISIRLQGLLPKGEALLQIEFISANCETE